MLTNSNLLFSAIWAVCETIVIVAGGIRAIYKFNKRLDRIEYQLYNNGGESMKDAVDRIESDVTELKINQAIIKTKLGE